MTGTNPIERRDGRPYIAGTSVATAKVWESHEAGCEPWVIAREYALSVEAVEFAIGYERKRNARRAQRRNDPKRPMRLQGKRNAASGRRAEKWVCADLGEAWKLQGGAGSVDVAYGSMLGSRSVALGCAIQSLEVKRRKGADRSLRLQLFQNGASALVRTYGQEAGVRQIEPVVVMRWSVWKQLLIEAGYVVKGAA